MLKISEFSSSNPWRILSACFALLLLSIPGLLKLSVTSDNRSFFGPNDPKFSQLTDFESQFSPYSTISFLITSQDSIAVSEQHRSAHSLVTEAARNLPLVNRVDSLVSIPTVHSRDDEVLVEPLLSDNCHHAKCSISEEELKSPNVQNRFISSDGKTSAIVALVSLDKSDSSQVRSVMAASNAHIRAPFSDLYPDLQLHITGGVPMMQEFAIAASQDMTTLIPLAGVLLLLILWWVLGGAYLASTMTFLGAATCMITLGIAGWTGLVLNSATSSIPIVIFSLILASTMHLFLHLTRGEEIHGAKSMKSAVSSALSINIAPVLMTIATTAIGMLSLLNVPSPPVRDLGLWVAIGLIIGLVLTLTVLPAILCFQKAVPSSAFASSLQRKFNDYARLIEAKRVPLSPFLILFAIAVSGIAVLEIDDDFVTYFNEESTFRKDTDFASENLAGPYGVELVFTTTQDSTIFKSNHFSYFASLLDRLNNDPRVINTLSIYTVLDEVRSNFYKSQSPLEYESDDNIAQLFLAYDFSLQKDQSTADLVDITQQSTRFSVLLQPMTSKQIRAFSSEIEQWHDQHGQASLNLIVTGESVPTAYLSVVNIKSMVVGILFSLAFSACVMGVYFRSLRIAVIALISILVPVLIGFGIWGWIYGSIGLAATVVVAITIGVVIDDSIHMIVRAHDGQDHLGLDGIHSAAYSVYRVGTAIVGTTLILAGAFSILLFSGFELNSAFGLCTILVLSSAMLFDLVVLPHLIEWALPSEMNN